MRKISKKKIYRTADRHRDLFGEVPVTWPDVWTWLEIVALIPADSWRAAYYVRWWNVPDKIRAAKLAGDWPPQPDRIGGPCGHDQPPCQACCYRAPY